MTPARSFARLWLLFTLLTLAYAAFDLAFNPWIRLEVGFSMKPDLTRLPDLMHWGGRLFYNGAWWLLVCNAVALSGIAALVASAVWNLYRALRPLSPARDTRSGPVSEGISP